MKFDQYALISAFVILAAATAPNPLPNDPKRSVASIARDLGIAPAQFVTCFNNVTPATQGSTPT